MHTVLLADDSATVQRVIALTFVDQAFRVVSVADGREAMARLQAERPDIVLAGTRLAGVSGYDLARFVKSQAALKHVPVVLLAGAFEAPNAAELASSGAAGILEKPLDPTTVLNRVKELLGLRSEPAAPTTARSQGRLVTSAEPPRAARPPAGPARVLTRPPAAPPATPRAPNRPATPDSWDELRRQSGLEPDARPVEAQPHGAGGDYLDTLDAAFDSLDAKLAGRSDAAPARSERATPPQRAGERASGAPVTPPQRAGERASGAPVTPPQRAGERASGAPVTPPQRAGERASGAPAVGAPPAPRAASIVTERLTPVPSGADPASSPLAADEQESSPPVFEVDETWFAASEKDEAARAAERRQLAAEMGIHDLELPEPASGEVRPVVPATGRRAAAPTGEASRGPGAGPVAEAFNTLLAIEQAQAHGAAHPGAAVPPVVLQTPAPEITDEMLDRLAADVAERLSGRIPAPVITDDLLSQIAAEVANRLVVPPIPPPSIESGMLDRIAGQLAERLRVPAPAITGEMLAQVARQVAERLVVQAPPPQMTGEMLDRIAAQVAERLTVQAPPAEVTGDTISRIADEVATRLPRPASPAADAGIPDEVIERIADLVASRVPAAASPPAPTMTSEMIERLAAQVGSRLAAQSVSAPPEVTGEMVERIAAEVARRLPAPAPARPAELTSDMLDRLAATVAERLGAGPLGGELTAKLAAGVQGAVRQVVSEASERLVRDEIARIRAEAASDPDN
jgi:CheY-like chemotaxis protein